MRVNEVFHTIQGEGVHQRLPMVFVRLQGCNLSPNCRYCDTAYAQKEGGTEMSVKEILSAVASFTPKPEWACVTGGEPLSREDELFELVTALRERFFVEVFTNGSVEKPCWYERVSSWVVDIKCPSSGVCGVSYGSWFQARSCDQVKFVVGNKGDLDFARTMIERNRFEPPTVLISPVIYFGGENGDIAVFDKPWLQEVWKFCLELGVQYSLQLHKVVWGNKKGV